MTENTLQQRINNLFMGFLISKQFMRNTLKSIKNGKSEYIEKLITKIENPKETPQKETRTTTKTKIIPKEIECVKCKMSYIAAKSPLQVYKRYPESGKATEYICKNCA